MPERNRSTKEFTPSSYFECPEPRFHPSCCDFRVTTNDGCIFNIHSEMFESKVIFFQGMLSAEFIEKKSRECSLRNVDSDVFRSVCEFVYGISKDLYDGDYLPVYIVANYLLFGDLEEFCAAKISRNPFLALEHPVFVNALLKEDYGIIEPVLALDLYLDDRERLRKLLERVRVKRNAIQRALTARVRRDFNSFTVYDQDADAWLRFSGSYWFPYSDEQLESLRRRMTYVTRNGETVWYATERGIHTHGRERPLSVQACTDGRPGLPPLLMKYGRSICWTSDNRRNIHFERDDEPLKLRLSNLYTLRVIANTDDRDYRHFTCLTTFNRKPVILHHESIRDDSKKFRNLHCLLHHIACVCVMNDVIYVVGRLRSDDDWDVFMAYRSNQWHRLPRRLCGFRPEILIPFENRLYILVNGERKIEVYEPKLETWMLDDSPKIHRFAGHFL